MADLTFDRVRKEFSGGVVAVHDFSLAVPGPSMTVLVGPSGCGKTTLLRMVAGLESPTSGTIHLGDQRLDVLPPRRRDVAMVFQSYALYPHMTVAQNLSFGLKLRKVPAEVVTARVAEVARTLEIETLLDRKPGALSGGQRQRVALGRAIIREPRVFLFDEPLSNLDARLRAEMRAMIKRLYQRLRVTSVYVTHDQVEAMTIGERLVVMNQGRIHQVGSPAECYDAPADMFVASFLGSPPMNFLEGRVDAGGAALVTEKGTRLEMPPALCGRLEAHGGDRVVLGVRPEHVTTERDAVADAVEMRGRVVLEEPLGHETLTHIEVDGQGFIARGRDGFGDGGPTATLYVDPRRVHLFAAGGGARLAGPPPGR